MQIKVSCPTTSHTPIVRVRLRGFRVAWFKTKGRGMTNTLKLVALAVVTLFAMMAANFARDLSYQIHAIIVMLVSGGLL